MPKELVTYNPATGQLESIPEAFKQRGFPVAVFSWRNKNAIDVGKSVTPGMELADIFWEDNEGTREVLRAPANCRGMIKSVNRAINLDDLPRPNSPAQVLLRLRLLVDDDPTSEQ